jgi:hypothetical protein
MFATQKKKNLRSSGEITRSSSRDKHLYKSKEVVLLIGRVNAVIKAHRTDTQSFFGCGSNLMKNMDGIIRGRFL